MNVERVEKSAHEEIASDRGSYRSVNVRASLLVIVRPRDLATASWSTQVGCIESQLLECGP